jgi:Leucine-rich repeat (LRR) protein
MEPVAPHSAVLRRILDSCLTPIAMRIRSRLFQLCCSLLLPVLFAQGAAAQEIFPDENLRAVIKEILVKKQINKEQIEEADLKSIYFLEASGREIKDLTGLEKCTNLASIKLPENAIESVAALAELKNVQELHLQGNKITDIAPIGGMVKLQYIQLERNQVTKLDGLEKLPNLRSLYLSDNQVESLAPLAGLAKLTSLYLNNNKVSDLSPLKDLKWISLLGLKNNQVSDLSPLAGFTELRYTFLEGNPLQDLTPLVEMARKDVEGEKRFAPYWFLYLDVDSLPEAARSQVTQLQELGVRVNKQ